MNRTENDNEAGLQKTWRNTYPMENENLPYFNSMFKKIAPKIFGANTDFGDSRAFSRRFRFGCLPTNLGEIFSLVLGKRF